MSSYQKKSKLGKYMLIGSVIGAAVSLLKKETRTYLKNDMGAVKSNGQKLASTIKNNPTQVSNYLKATANNIKMTAQEVSQDMKEMAGKVSNAKNSSTQAYHYAVEASDEISQIAHKVRNTGQGMMKLDTPSTMTPTALSSSTSIPSTPLVSDNSTSISFPETKATSEWQTYVANSATSQVPDSPPSSFESTTLFTPTETETVTTASTPEKTKTTLSVEEETDLTNQ